MYQNRSLRLIGWLKLIDEGLDLLAAPQVRNGSYTSNVFSGNGAGTRKSSAAYRLQSSGPVTDNDGLFSNSNFENQNPKKNLR